MQTVSLNKHIKTCLPMALLFLFPAHGRHKYTEPKFKWPPYIFNASSESKNRSYRIHNFVNKSLRLCKLFHLKMNSKSCTDEFE